MRKHDIKILLIVFLVILFIFDLSYQPIEIMVRKIFGWPKISETIDNENSIYLQNIVNRGFFSNAWKFYKIDIWQFENINENDSISYSEAVDCDFYALYKNEEIYINQRIEAYNHFVNKEELRENTYNRLFDPISYQRSVSLPDSLSSLITYSITCKSKENTNSENNKTLCAIWNNESPPYIYEYIVVTFYRDYDGQYLVEVIEQILTNTEFN